MSIIDVWIEKQQKRDDYVSQNKSLEKINMICQKKIRVHELGDMRRGKRHIPDCVYWLMVSEVLIDQLEAAGWENAALELTSQGLIDLVNNITPPRRFEVHNE